MKMVSLGRAFVSTGDGNKKANEMFDRAEALQNAAKAIKGISALDDDALEFLYSTTKAERRRRNSVTFEKKVGRLFHERFTGEEIRKMTNEEMADNVDKIREEMRGKAKPLPDLESASVSGVMTPYAIANMRTLAARLTEQKPGIKLIRMEAVTEKAIEVTYLLEDFAEENVETFTVA
jgi:hypothetical protein